MERIYDMIMDWTRDEEANYQALLTSKEVSSFANKDDSQSIKSSKDKEKETEKKESDKNFDKKTTTGSKKKTGKRRGGGWISSNPIDSIIYFDQQKTNLPVCPVIE